MNADEFRRLILETLHSPGFIRANFGGPRRCGPDALWNRVLVRRIVEQLQFEYFDARKSISKNYSIPDSQSPIEELLDLHFSSIHLVTDGESIDCRISKKGKFFVGRGAATATASPEPHNRVKDLPLPEGESNRLLEAMGILDRNGRVRPTHRAKFTQINEFLKQFLHVLDDSDLKQLNRPIEILDAGCGSSYLTLAVHYFLTERLGLSANLLGVDVNDEVIRKSLARADVLGADGVKFACEKIDSIQGKPDVVIALHACDTATDAALAAAIRSKSKLILSVPCCHHHLNEQLKAVNVEVLRPILRHGILHERQADIITDAFRALLLRIHGYRTEIVEFISPEHTARNLMIRAVKTTQENDPQFVQEYQAMKRFFGVTPYLETLISSSVK